MPQGCRRERGERKSTNTHPPQTCGLRWFATRPSKQAGKMCAFPNPNARRRCTLLQTTSNTVYAKEGQACPLVCGGSGHPSRLFSVSCLVKVGERSTPAHSGQTKWTGSAYLVDRLRCEEEGAWGGCFDVRHLFCLVLFLTQ